MTLSERLRMHVRLWKYRLREERESIAFMRRQPLAGRTVIDVGANKGIYSYWMSRQVGAAGRVIAFEPQTDLREHLDDLKRTFRLDNLQVVSQGLSNRRATFTMHRDKPGALGATLEPPSAPLDAGSPRQQIEVEVLPLDDFCAEQRLHSIAFIKCDVEGHELAVFQGAREVLQRDQPVLLLECHRHEAVRGELFDFLAALGYRGSFIHKGKSYPCEQFADFPYRKPSVQHRNYMFAPG